jgi:hypothetical protein
MLYFNHNGKNEKDFQILFHKKARRSVQVSEDKEWTTTVTVSVRGSTGVQEWTGNDSPSRRAVDQKTTWLLHGAQFANF